VHFLRSILRAAGNYKTAYSIYKRMKALLICKSQSEYKELCDLLIVYKFRLVANWARYKRYLVITLGLNKHCSLINYELFNRLRYYINAVEQIVNKLYAFGIR
ncbi:uncharacterized protein K441DRAFT_586177, partial [Cenococcum geophilum 1.58]|uniref:uncharacterized protein n=1 Tax=Cenococcum geophilum 1.58 TaxID=794803 RepID=UPI00358F5C7E